MSREVSLPDAAAHHREIERLINAFVKKPQGPRINFEAREAALLDIFDHCGFSTRRNVKIHQRREVDGEFEAEIDGKHRSFLIEIKGAANPESIIRAVDVARQIRHTGRYDRASVVVSGEIPEAVRHMGELEALGYIDLLGIPELRSWLWKHAPALQSQDNLNEPTCAQIIRTAMQAIAERLARAPDEIGTIEWRDLERLLREVFEGMGFETMLTRSGKDGGFDLELATNDVEGRQVYLVEVKHWTDQKPGRGNLRKLVRVTAKQKATLGILLSSSGFAPSIYEGFTQAERDTVALGGREKIIALCSTFYRLNRQIWTSEASISSQLIDGLF